MAEEEKKTSASAEEATADKGEEKNKEVAPEPEKKEEPAEEKAEESVEVPAQFKKLVEEVEKMTVLELNELVKVLEKKFGVSAQAVAVAAPGAGGGEAEEQDSFSVELTAAGEQKIQVIKAVKEILGLGLKEAKDMVDGAPNVLKEGVKKEEAEEMKKKVEDAGGSVTLK
jgi:large subunit ribosomal protein L7/L12|tara:strand:- start:15205 stop:15714 length:510 start_codon:yes stop_codon:yes gene_type:complete